MPGPALPERVAAAYQRYGARAFAVAAYRALFQWPTLRSRVVAGKLSMLLGAQIGRAALFGHDVFFSIPGGRLAIGESTSLGDRCHVEISANPRGELTIGRNCYFAHDVHIAAVQSIVIGDNVRIAEFTSLRDTSHNYQDARTNINEQGDTLGRIVIGDDVWIGKGSLILGSPEGTVIGKGAVIGAHTLVKSSVPEFAIAVGSPAKIVGHRE